MRGLCVGLRTFPPLVGRWYGPTHGESDGVGVGGLIGQSGRVAAAQEMAISGVSLPMMQRHGRWKTSAMPARYSERADTVLSGWARFELLRGNTKKEIGMDITINEVAGPCLWTIGLRLLNEENRLAPSICAREPFA